MNIIDTHAHLSDISDLKSVLSRASDAGVSDIIVPGVDLQSNQTHLALSFLNSDSLQNASESECVESTKISPVIHSAFGVHPGNITTREDINACFVFIRENISRAIAVGETGLDYSYASARTNEMVKQEQRFVFQLHIDLASESGLPLIVHSRGAWRDCLNMVKLSGIKKAVFHWYSGPRDVLIDLLDAGFLVSFSPALEYSPECRQAALYAPLNRILIETDSPVSCPASARKASEPADIWRTLCALSVQKNMDKIDVLQIVNANARTFFSI